MSSEIKMCRYCDEDLFILNSDTICTRCIINNGEIEKLYIEQHKLKDLNKYIHDELINTDFYNCELNNIRIKIYNHNVNIIKIYDKLLDKYNDDVIKGISDLLK